MERKTQYDHFIHVIESTLLHAGDFFLKMTATILLDLVYFCYCFQLTEDNGMHFPFLVIYLFLSTFSYKMIYVLCI